MIPLGTDQMAIDIGRRQFITALGGAAVAWPLAARAQQPGRLPIRRLPRSEQSREHGAEYHSFLATATCSWLGRGAQHHDRASAGRKDDPERVAEDRAEFVRLRVDIIVTTATNDAIAMKQATSVIPIVSAIMGDPVGTGLVASLARPGGQCHRPVVAVDRSCWQAARILARGRSGFHRLAILANPDSPNVRSELPEVQAGARRLGFDTATI